MKISTERRISGTRISKIVGVSKYGGPWDVYEEIVNGATFEGNRYTRRGNMMEPVIRSKYVERTGATLLTPKPEILEHEQYSFATYSPDDLPTVNGVDLVVDYKSANVSTIEGKNTRYGPEFSNQIPDDYYLQLCWGMAVTNRDRAHLFVVWGLDRDDGSFELSNKWKPRLYVVERDLGFEANLITAAERFWSEHILPRVPPEKPVKRTRRKAA